MFTGKNCLINFVCRFLVPFVIVGWAQTTMAGELGHFAPGAASIRDYNLPNPGFTYQHYNVFYTTDTYKDRNGNDVNSIGPITLDTDVDSIAIVSLFAWVFERKVLGAKVGASISPSIVRTSVQAALSSTTRTGVSIDESQWGFGDLSLTPLWLEWSTPRTAFGLTYTVYAPTGDYSDGAADNTGLGFWSHLLQTKFYFFPWDHQATAIMLTGSYEVSHDKDEADITPGDRFSLEYGVSQYIPVNEAKTMLLELGLSGHSQWQVENDSGADVVQALKVKDETHGFGGQIGLAYVPWNATVTLRFIREYQTEARFEGDLITLMLAKTF